MPKIKTDVGTKFGKLIVVRRLDIDKVGHRWVECRCECGNIVKVRTSSLLAGDNKSCGKCTDIEYKQQENYMIGRCRNGFEFKFDRDNIDLIKPFQWYKGDGGYVLSLKGKTKIALHKFVLGVSKEVMIDHINREKSDCRKSNLRQVTAMQNNWNRSKSKYGITSKYIGVSYCPRIKRFRARILHYGIEIHLGTFESEVEAAQARNIAGQYLRGEYHCDNDVPEPSKRMTDTIRECCNRYIFDVKKQR